MLNKKALIFLILAPFLWAQDDNSTTGESTAERLQRKKFEEEQRQDEYANSLRRRDWLQHRLILGPGVGSKYSAMGEDGMGFGVAAEYITSWHLSPFASYGFVFPMSDPSYDEYTLGGGGGWRVGLSYYLFPKSPLHLGVSFSYGTVYFDHTDTTDGDGTRAIISCKGWEGDVTITYLTNEWYYLNFIVGMYYIGDKMPGTDKPDWIIKQTLDNGILLDTTIYNTVGGKPLDDYGLVFGAGIGFALPDLFPDETEKRRRQREDRRERREERQERNSRSR
ncbi:MAG TPA: hypothetical protein VLM37_04775 [Fibrobacteraceae bacterium]|nr:hypothetical protein [Fibrobacteraceae bacterium]